MQITAELLEFQNTVGKFFSEECQIDFVQKKVEGKISEKESADFLTKVATLGMKEYFFDPEGGTYRELILLAEEAGKYLFPLPIIEDLFSRYLLKLKISKKNPLTVGFYAQGGSGIYIGIDSSSDIQLVDFTSAKVFLLTSKDYKLTVLAGLDRTQPLSKIVFSESIPSKKLNDQSIEIYNLYSLLKVAEIYGATKKSFDLTLEYIKTRKQFGVTIGSFQAVQHSIANLYLKLEQIRALIYFAAWTKDNSPTQFPFSANVAIEFVIDNAANIIETCLQLHGGIGFTWEYQLHLYLRRVKMLEGLMDNKQTQLIL